jgi:hypothetical protein
MEHSSPSDKPLPDGVSEADLVDGPRVLHLASGRGSFLPPEPENLVKPIPVAPPPPVVVPPPSTAQIKRDYPAAIELALDVLSTKLLLLIALVAACGAWGAVIWSPDIWRIVGASAFSVFVFLPSVALYWKSPVGEK